MKIAIVHDWLVANAGAEKVLSAMLELYPEADLFSLVNFLNRNDRNELLGSRDVKTSFIQNLPFARKHFRNYLPLFPKAMESLNFKGYDLIISSSWAFAKGVKRPKESVHICYCHTPIRYAWDLKKEYVSSLGLAKRIVVEATLAYIRRWDIKTLDRVDFFIANSVFVKRRIKRIYSIEAPVIYPPVDVDEFMPFEDKDDYYITVSRLVPYKRVDLIVEAFNRLKRKLLIVGDGPEIKNLKSMAKGNIEFLGFQKRDIVVKLLQRAKAFVFAAVEDFGIAPVEAIACGTPVVAYARGGVTETVKNGVNGILFFEQKPEAIENAIRFFENREDAFDPHSIAQTVQKFSRDRFIKEFSSFVTSVV